MSSYRLSAIADTDMEQIWEYIALHNPTAADRLLDRLGEAFDLLANNPGFGQRRDDLRPNLQLFPVGSYVILYYPEDDGIEVAGILHGARDTNGLFQSGER